MDKDLKKLLKETEGSSSGSSGSLMQFLVGLIMLGAGLFWIFQSVSVDTAYGYGWIFGRGGMGIPSGTVIIPLLIGILMLFLMDKKIFGWIVVAIGIVIILLSIIMSVRLHFRGGSLFNYIMMFSLTLVGGGLVLKNLFKK